MGGAKTRAWSLLPRFSSRCMDGFKPREAKAEQKITGGSQNLEAMGMDGNWFPVPCH